MAAISGNIAYRKKLGYLGEDYFKEDIERVPSNKPNMEFQNISEEKEQKFLKESFYYNYFLRKITRVMGTKLEKALNIERQLAQRYFYELPYLNIKRLTKKLVAFLDYKST